MNEPTVEIEVLKTRMTLLDKWFWVLVAGFFLFRIGDNKRSKK